MWLKTLSVNFKKQQLQVVLFLDGENDDSKPVVVVKSMLNEFFLEEQIIFEDRDKAYDFIKNYPLSMAIAFITREGYASGAVE
jgi:hypothetical protein